METAKAALADAPNVTVVPVPINDGWARDWGPSVRHPCFLAPLQALAVPSSSVHVGGLLGYCLFQGSRL